MLDIEQVLYFINVTYNVKIDSSQLHFLKSNVENFLPILFQFFTKFTHTINAKIESQANCSKIDLSEVLKILS